MFRGELAEILTTGSRCLVFTSFTVPRIYACLLIFPVAELVAIKLKPFAMQLSTPYEVTQFSNKHWLYLLISMWSYLCHRWGLARSKLVRPAIKAKFEQIQRHLRFRGAKQPTKFTQLLGRVGVTRTLTSTHSYPMSLQGWTRKGRKYKVGALLRISDRSAPYTGDRQEQSKCSLSVGESWWASRMLDPLLLTWDRVVGRAVAAHPGFTRGTHTSTYTEPNVIIGTGVSWPPRSCSLFKDSTLVIHIVILASLSPNDIIWGQDNFCHFMFYKSPHKCTWFSNNKKAISFLNRSWIKCYDVPCSCYRGCFSK